MTQSTAYSRLMSDMQQDGQLSAAQRARDGVAEGMFAARDDIRHRLIEEAWTGQQQTGNIQLPGYQPEPDVAPSDPNPEAGNIWGNSDSPEWGGGDTVWAHENSPGVWGHEHAPDQEAATIEPPEIEAPEPEQLEP